MNAERKNLMQDIPKYVTYTGYCALAQTEARNRKVQNHSK